MKTDEQIRAHVMRRVRAIYWARQIARPAPRVLVLAALGTALVSSVSVSNIAVNAWNVRGAGQLVSFAVAAFFNTTLGVQALTAAIGAMVLWFSFDGLRKVQLVIDPPEAEPAIVQ